MRNRLRRKLARVAILATAVSAFSGLMAPAAHARVCVGAGVSVLGIGTSAEPCVPTGFSYERVGTGLDIGIAAFWVRVTVPSISTP